MNLSDLLGYTSIGCWLFAQFPQVLENIRQQSVEGLALPFLLNWLLGDLTNLIGCILTHQLPFQTYLATYFCFVDFSLLSQFFYYRSLKRSHTGPASHSRTSTISALPHTRRSSSERPASRYLAISAAAADIAATAAQQEGAETRVYRQYKVDSSASRERTEDVDEVDDEALARLADSFQSDMSTASTARKRVSWNEERLDSKGGSLGRSMVSPGASMSHMQPLKASTEFADSAQARGRSLQRVYNLSEPDQGTWDEERARESSNSLSKQRRSSRASRRGAGIVFLGVFAFFGVNFLSTSSWEAHRTHEGYVLTPVIAHNDTGLSPLLSSAVQNSLSQSAFPDDASMERIVGRIFAWTCTTLYLTSRLPQIWKNYTRKSVEGLSIFLFVFAFLGNFFYVASILTSPSMYLPPPQAAVFIRESIPYLLGSGGTLMFDVTIVAQSFLYRPGKRSAHGGRHSKSRSRVASPGGDEETGLLSGDRLAESRAALRRNTSLSRVSTSRTRTSSM
ncbi:hypothetical protein NEOLEDRAFT_844459 [Neolentinus lepideus HHB14362 ss-1]|uniref:PQ-loop-domain-containing protein n=1 Tax=Neolentinus lepideus HHB14362 ss-1 TaxID=1314782 RepID=A0A165UN23_9AGAM|nr:hypothetical protein NEOLEDRAFT_844459 [Neolentinus lepideus HHB14362 ss-1]